MTSRDDLERQDTAEASRFWVDAMDAALLLLAEVRSHPIEEDSSSLADLREAAGSAGVEMSFSTRSHPNGSQRMHLVRRDLVAPLLGAAEDFAENGHTLMIEDAFRTYDMQRSLAVSDEVLLRFGRAMRQAEPDASPERLIERLSVVVASRPSYAGHMAGAAVDVSVLAADGRPIDRGGPYLEVSAVMPMDSPFISRIAAENRSYISEVMGQRGFSAYPFEFWHYSKDDSFGRVLSGESTPARYGPVEVGIGGEVSPLDDLERPLNDPLWLADRLRVLLER